VSVARARLGARAQQVVRTRLVVRARLAVRAGPEPREHRALRVTAVEAARRRAEPDPLRPAQAPVAQVRVAALRAPEAAAPERATLRAAQPQAELVDTRHRRNRHGG
jgi:hypothetical protein